MNTHVDKEKLLKESPSAASIPIFSNAVPMKILRVRDSVMKYFRPILHKHKFTEQQWRVMRTLQHSRMGTLQLAKECAIMPSSVSRLTQGLVKRGMIVRDPSSNLNDLRQVQFMLTEKGSRKIEEIAPQIQAAYKKIQDKAGEENVKKLLQLLEVFIKAL